MATSDNATYLRCIIIDPSLRVLHNHFWLRVPATETCDKIFPLLRVAVPSLRNSNDAALRLYKPRTDITPRALRHLDDTQVDLENPVETQSLIRNEFQGQQRIDSAPGDSFPVDTIICLDGGAESKFYPLTDNLLADRFPERSTVGDIRVLVEQARSGPDSNFTIRLRAGDNIRQPSLSVVRFNHVCLVVGPNLPDFVVTLEGELRSRRSPVTQVGLTLTSLPYY